MKTKAFLATALFILLSTVSFSQHFAVAADKMNVLYIGVENPVSIAIAGVSAESIQVSIDNGAITGSKGKYIVRISDGSTATIDIMANGKKVGSQMFRVKRIPTPVTYAGQYKGEAHVSKAELESITSVNVTLENFDFDVHFEVVSFDMSSVSDFTSVIFTSKTKALTPEMKSQLQSLKSGSKVYFENVTVKAPDGTLRKIPGVTLKIQ
jgi:gliding motility-associated protein GldM